LQAGEYISTATGCGNTYSNISFLAEGFDLPRKHGIVSEVITTGRE
jgi:hypothetical protein